MFDGTDTFEPREPDGIGVPLKAQLTHLGGGLGWQICCYYGTHFTQISCRYCTIRLYNGMFQSSWTLVK